MKKLLLVLIAVIYTSTCLGQSSKLDQAIEMMTHKLLLNQNIDNNQIIAIGDFPIQKNKITDMSYYLAKKMYSKLVSYKNFNVVEQDKVNFALKNTERNYEEFIDYRYLAELGENIFINSGLAPQLYIFGSLTDSDDEILIECKLINAGTAKTLSSAETKLTATSFTDKLLGNKITHRPETESDNRTDTIIIEKEKIVEVPVIQEKIVEKIVEVPVVIKENSLDEQISPSEDAEIFFQDNFSKYNNGDPVPDWGHNVIVIERNDHKKYLTSQAGGVHPVSQQIKFPENFTFQFEYLKGGFNNEIVLIDNKDQQLTISLKQSYENTVGFPNTVRKSAGLKEINEFRLVKNGSTYKAYINGEFLLTYDDNKFKDFIMFKMQIPEGRYFTNFIGKSIN